MQPFKYLCTIICLTFSVAVYTQQNIQVKFMLNYGNQPLQLHDKMYQNNADTVWIDVCKFYISNIRLYNKNELVYTQQNSFHLLNVNDTNSLNINLTIPTNTVFDAIHFNVGIDSATNVAGALGGPLDPLNGMYWTWQSGYINVKVEGRSNVCATRNNAFTFHLGGYQYPYNTLQTIVVRVQQKNTIKIIANLQQFITAIHLANQNQIMSTGNQAVQLSNLFSTIFLNE